MLLQLIFLCLNFMLNVYSSKIPCSSRFNNIHSLYIQSQYYRNMDDSVKKQKLNSHSTDDDMKIKTIEDLDQYEYQEERLRIVLLKSKLHLFSNAGLFKNLAKARGQPLEDRRDYESKVVLVTKKWTDLPKDLQDVIEKESEEYSVVYHTITYSDMTAEESFKLVIGEDVGHMVGFEVIGHIAHLNIPAERDSLKNLIAKIIIDKHRHIKTVINKRSELQNEFRTMDIELLAGEENYKATAIENGLKFDVDFQNVYWNSRLIQERTRITDLLNVDDILIDMFAGVGPFAVYAAKKGCNVFANDLNPIGAEYITRNASLNKVKNKIKAFNNDARDFINQIIKKNHILNKFTTTYNDLILKQQSKLHFVMNLPKIAINFLDVFYGLGDGIEESDLRECQIHCYCFATPENYENEISERLDEVLRREFRDYKVTKVRSVSPKKTMYCIEFKCPNWLLLGQ